MDKMTPTSDLRKKFEEFIMKRFLAPIKWEPNSPTSSRDDIFNFFSSELESRDAEIKDDEFVIAELSDELRKVKSRITELEALVKAGEEVIETFVKEINYHASTKLNLRMANYNSLKDTKLKQK